MPAAEPPAEDPQEAQTGAEAVLRTLAAAGVRACFANPGTSEMHLVAALDRVPEVRGVLALFEGVATGAADGYGRMADAPAATLLHLGPGLGNGLANLHNAHKARTPVVNVVGDHARRHQQHDAPLSSDVEGVARPVSGWVRSSGSAREAAADAAAAVAAATAHPGDVATLVLPADVAWSPAPGPVAPVAPAPPPRAPEDAVREAAAALRGDGAAALLVGGHGARGPALGLAAAIAEATGARLLLDTFVPRVRRGAGLPAPEKLPYFAEPALEALGTVDELVIVGTRPPVAFFAYPGVPGDLVPESTTARTLATPAEDVEDALRALAEELGVDVPSADAHAADGGARAGADGEEAAAGAPRDGALADAAPDPGTALDVAVLGAVLAAAIPDDAIVVDEALTASAFLWEATAGAAPHDWLQLMGGAIGQGLPVAVGAAVACPGRPVLALQADGSAMYTLQALWTMAREGLDVTTVVLANRAYAILQVELQRVGADPSSGAARELMGLDRPELDFVALAAGMGVPGERATTAGELEAALRRGRDAAGPYLVEAVL